MADCTCDKEIDATPSALMAQIADLKYKLDLLTYENDGLKNELRNKKEEIDILRQKLYEQQQI